jgi:hypothetical protein
MFPAPDVDAVLQKRGFLARRFTIDPQCPTLDCYLVISTEAGPTQRIPLSSVHRAQPDSPDYLVAFDVIDRVAAEEPSGTEKHFKPIQDIARAITDAYARSMQMLFATGCFGILIGLWMLRRNPEYLYLTGIAAAAAVAVASRIALCSYVDVTAFSTMSTLYLSSATPFVLIVVGLGNWLGARAILRGR